MLRKLDRVIHVAVVEQYKVLISINYELFVWPGSSRVLSKMLAKRREMTPLSDISQMLD